MPSADFDEKTHTYTEGGVKLPSVTRIIRAAGLMPPFYGDEPAMRRGTMVHRACEFHDEGDLDESTVDPAIAGYLDGWKKFRAETGFVASCIEWRRAHPIYGYAGTVDRIGVFDGRPTVIDIKTGSFDDWMGIQLAAYEGLANSTVKIGRHQRLGVVLTAEGKYSVLKFEERSDWPIFLSALSLYNWRKSRGRIDD
jgi:hypothetical protein